MSNTSDTTTIETQQQKKKLATRPERRRGLKHEHAWYNEAKSTIAIAAHDTDANKRARSRRTV
jgi:hypothetical protein